MQKVAFFDIDGTIFRSSLLIELVEKFIDEGVFSEAVRQVYEPDYKAWLDREGSYEKYISDVVKVFEDNIKGVHYGEMADLGRSVVEENSKRVYRYTRDLIPKLKKQNYYLVAISQSPKAILDEFCVNYGFDKVYGRIYEIGPTDRFTGVTTDEHLIQDKANIVKRVFARGDFDETATVAVGDTEGDISMLSLADQPICFNPNNELYQHALKMGWKVVVERKDVIYER